MRNPLKASLSSRRKYNKYRQVQIVLLQIYYVICAFMIYKTDEYSQNICKFERYNALKKIFHIYVKIKVLLNGTLS